MVDIWQQNAIRTLLAGLFLGFLLIAGPFQTAYAQNQAPNQARHEAAQFAGLDGIALTCIDHSDGSYGERLCNDYLESIETALASAGVPVTKQGYFRHDAEHPGKPAGYATPLNWTLFIRGTAGNTVAIQLRARASVSYEAAVERGTDSLGRRGELVMWERSVTGSGRAADLINPIREAMTTRSSAFLGNVTAHWPQD